MALSFDFRKAAGKLRSAYRKLKNADGKLLAYLITGGVFLVLALIQIIILVAGKIQAPRGTMPLIIFDLAVVAFSTALSLRRSDELKAARNKARPSRPPQHTRKAQPPQNVPSPQHPHTTRPVQGVSSQQFHRKTSATTRRTPTQRRNNDEV